MLSPGTVSEPTVLLKDQILITPCSEIQLLDMQRAKLLNTLTQIRGNVQCMCSYRQLLQQI